MIRRITKENKISASGITIVQKTICGEYKTHWHEFFEIEFILSGSGEYVIDGRAYNVEKNMLFFMTPINFHRVSVNGNAEIINIMFTEDLISDFALSFLTAGSFENAMQFSEPDSGFIKNVLSELLAASRQNDKTYCAALLNVLLLKIGKRTKKSIPQLTYVQSAMLYILKNFRSEITLADTAGNIGISSAYLSSIFHSETGVKFKEYLNTTRYDYAKKLLIYSDMSISEICSESGFNDYANFIRGFTSRFGTAPGKFRKIRDIKW